MPWPSCRRKCRAWAGAWRPSARRGDGPALRAGLPKRRQDFTIREVAPWCAAASVAARGGRHVTARRSSMTSTMSAIAPGSSSEHAPGQSPIALQIIERAMRLLDALAAQPDPVTLKELSATTGLHASTAHRILNDLVVGRYVERVDNGLYQLGMRLLELGSLVKGRLNVREAAISAM